MSQAAESALDNLMDQEWFYHAERPTVSRTTDGEIIVWCGSEIYRISSEGHIYRIYTGGGEVVILD